MPPNTFTHCLELSLPASLRCS